VKKWCPKFCRLFLKKMHQYSYNTVSLKNCFYPYSPEQKFEDYIPVEDKETLEPKKQILKRSKDLGVVVGSSQKVRTTC